MLKACGIPLHSVLADVGWSDAPLDRLDIEDRGQLLPTSMPIAAAATAALGCVGLAALQLWELSSGRRARATIDTRAASLAMSSSDFLRVAGKGKNEKEITGFYPVKSGGWVYLHGNFPHLRDGLLNLFKVANDRAALAAALLNWSRHDVENMATERGMCATGVRTRKEWQAHPQATAIAQLPLIEIRKLADGPKRILKAGDAPLEGIRALDLSRVIAGPMAGRALAEHGATVMLVSAPHLPCIEDLVIDTGFGKFSSFINLCDSEGRRQLEHLISDADVFIDAYRPGSLGRRGFAPADLARMRPGIVSATISAYSRAGPWHLQRGYDSLVQAACGLAFLNPTPEPRRLPCQPLDYLTGYLTAFGIMVAMRRQALEGGSWHVELSLARTAAWLWEMNDMIGAVSNPPHVSPPRNDILDLLENCCSPFGDLSYLRPALRLTSRPGIWSRPPVLLGSHPS
ncbi:MAG: CoA transferase, partial [Planctomycetota bacterium]